jgi:hypothetical protein
LTFTNACSQPGIVEASTNALLPNDSGEDEQEHHALHGARRAHRHADPDRDPGEREGEADREAQQRGDVGQERTAVLLRGLARLLLGGVHSEHVGGLGDAVDASIGRP